MHTWLHNLSRSAQSRKQNRISRQRLPDWHLKFEALKFGLERLEDRVMLAADLAIDKSVAPSGTVVPGELLTYTIHAQNLAAGATAATGVVVTDTLPAGETFIGATVSGSGAPTIGNSAGTVTADLGTLAPGGANTITVQALVNTTATGTLTNSAAMTNTSADTNPTNATASNTVSTAAPTNNVSVAKDSVPTNATGAVGAALTYHVTITNNTTNAAAGVQLIDKLDPNETFISASDTNGDTFTNVGGTITGTVANLAGSGTDTVAIVAMPTTAAGNNTVTNTAAIAIPTGNLSTSVIATKTNAVTAASANAANVSVAQESPGVGATFTVGAPNIFAATVTNNTATAASGVLFVEHLDPNEAFVSASDDNGDIFSFAGGTITGTITSLAALGTDEVRITLVPTPAAGLTGNVTSTAIVAVPGGNLSANNVATNTYLVSAVPATGPNVSVTKDSVPGNAVGTVGAALTYQVTLTNNSSTPATDGSSVFFYDRLDPNEQFVSASDSNGGSFPIVDGALNGIIHLAANGTDTITIVAVPTAAGSVTNTAIIGIFPGNQSNGIVATKTNLVNPASATGANVSVAKDSVPSNATGTTGAALTYDVTLTNNTTTPVSGVQFFDVLDPNELFVSASDTNGDSLRFGASSISGTINLAASGTDTITIIATPTVGSAVNVTNTAAVAIAGGNQSTNIVATKTNRAAPASTNGSNIVLQKDSVPSSAVGAVGSPLIYHVLVNNDSTTAAANVQLTDVLDANESFVSASDNNGTTFSNADGTITGTIASLAGDTTDTVTIVAIPLLAAANLGHVTNTATITVSGGNFAGILQATKTNTVIPATATQASLSIAKTGPATGAVGTNFSYSITVANAAGAASAAGVTMTDLLPFGVTFVSATDTSGGTINNALGTVTDNIGTLAPGATDTITIVVTPGLSTGGTTITNFASVTTTTTNIGTPTTASATTAIVQVTLGPALSIHKSASTTGTVGHNLTYTVVIANSGSGAAAATTFTDTLPAGLTLLSATDSLGGTITNTGGTLSENIGSLAPGVTDTMTIIVTPGISLAGQSVTNTASVSATNFNSGVAIASSAATSISETTITTGVGLLAGVPGDGTPQTFVQNLYRELLGREPDSGGEATWLAFLQQNNNATGRAEVIAGFMNSPEYATHYITTLYQVVLGRAPDAGGLQFWTGKMGQPGTPGGATGSSDEKAIVAAFFGSDEFYIQSGNTPLSWINALYEDTLGRAPDGNGAAFWANELAVRGADDRDGIVRDLLTTQEAAHLILDSFYPAVGGTSGHPLPAPGSAVGTSSTELATITGDGWENLYLQGPFDSQPQGNDSFFASLAGGAGWDDTQLLLLQISQFYTNPNRPITN